MKVNLILLAVFVLIFSGCASFTTAAWPPVEREVVGETTIVDEKSSYDYNLETRDKRFFVVGVPYCLEKESVYKVSQKQHRGIVFIVIETPIWGLGLADWVLSYMISENSLKKELLGYKPTGMKKKCENQIEVFPAQGEIIIQNSNSGEIFWTLTDENGEFFLDTIIGEYSGKSSWNVFFNLNDEIRYLTSFWW